MYSNHNTFNDVQAKSAREIAIRSREQQKEMALLFATMRSQSSSKKSKSWVSGLLGILGLN